MHLPSIVDRYVSFNKQQCQLDAHLALAPGCLLLFGHVCLLNVLKVLDALEMDAKWGFHASFLLMNELCLYIDRYVVSMNEAEMNIVRFLLCARWAHLSVLSVLGVGHVEYFECVGVGRARRAEHVAVGHVTRYMKWLSSVVSPNREFISIFLK